MRRAKSPSAHGFNGYDEPGLKKALKRAADKRTCQRGQAVLVVAPGRAINEVAASASVTGQPGYNWGNRYLAQHQGAALEETPRSGRPLIATAITKARMLRELQRHPRRRG